MSKRFGAEWHLYLSNPSPAEAIRAIDANTKGEFRRYLGTLSPAGRPRYYKVALTRRDNLLTKDELTQPTGQSDIYILPTIKGRKDGWSQIIAGVVLAIVTYGASAYLSAAGYAASTVATVGTVGYGMAASLVLGGVVQLLTPLPSINGPGGEGDGKGSNLFQGNAATISQGGAVPLVYGRALVSPMPISLSFMAVDQAIVNSFCVQEYETVTDPNSGIIDYVPISMDPSCDLPSNTPDE